MVQKSGFFNIFSKLVDFKSKKVYHIFESGIRKWRENIMVIKNVENTASQILKFVGGKENISHVLHCATRLRFNLKDYDKVELNEIKQIDGVMGTMKVGDQLQVIIGGEVNQVFEEVADQLGMDSRERKQIDADEEKKSLTLKSVGMGILDGLSGTMGPIIPAIVASAFFKMFTALLGPDLLNVLSVESNLYTLLSFVGDAGFYFFPVIVGYSAAQKFKVTPVLGILMGGIMIHPQLIQLVADGASFNVFGIPMYMTNYSGTIIPIILIVWVMSYVEKFFNTKLPQSIKSVFAPAFTIAVMLPLALSVIGPAGAFLGNFVVGGLLGLENYIGFLGVAIIAALYPFLVMTGMHMVLLTALFQIFATQGWDGFSAPALTYASFSIMGVAIGAALRLKDKEQKSLAIGYAITALVAGTSEPTIYGICARYKKPFIGLAAGGFAGGLYGGLVKVISATLVPSTSVTAVLAFVGKSTGNIINGIIASLIALAVAAAVTYFFGFEKDEPAISSSNRGESSET